ASGHAAILPMSVMKSRRRMAAPYGSKPRNRTNHFGWSERGRCPLWVKSGLMQCSYACPLWAINVRFASRRTAAKFASLFDEAGGGVRDMTEIGQTGEHA